MYNIVAQIVQSRFFCREYYPSAAIALQAARLFRAAAMMPDLSNRLPHCSPPIRRPQ